jgi:hypothetical protein
MDPEQAWQSALEQLQMEMPKASFDTWVRDSRVVAFDAGIFTIGVRNAYTRDWLESRLGSTVARLLMGIMNQTVEVHFVVEDSYADSGDEGAFDNTSLDQEAEGTEALESLHGSVIYLSRYENIVQPHKVVLVPGYLTRLLPERKGTAIFAYIGFSQVAWMNSRGNKDNEIPIDAPITSIAKFSASNRTAFYKLLGKASFWDSLQGLVSRSGDHFVLHRTLPLSKADAQGVHNWLKGRLEAGAGLEDALISAVGVTSGRLVGEVLPELYRPAGLKIDPALPVYVPDIVLSIKGQPLSEGESAAAMDLHTRIIYGFKDLTVRHYFLTEVIRRAQLSTDQAALVLVSRYHYFANPHTGEVDNKIVVPGGYKEMASWIGLAREKSVWEWLSGYTRSAADLNGHKRSGAIPGFLKDITDSESNASRSAKIFRVRMLEPIFGDSPDDLSWQNWDCDEDWRAYTIAMRQVLPKARPADEKSSLQGKDVWSLDDLMHRSGIFPEVQKKLKSNGVDAPHLLAWVLFCYSQKNTSNYSVHALPAKRLGNDPMSSPGKGFQRLSSLPPSIIRICVEATPTAPQLNALTIGSGLPEWDALMGTFNNRVSELKSILFGD